MKEPCMKERRGRAGRESNITGGINENRTQNNIFKKLSSRYHHQNGSNQVFWHLACNHQKRPFFLSWLMARSFIYLLTILVLLSSSSLAYNVGLTKRQFLKKACAATISIPIFAQAKAAFALQPEGFTIPDTGTSLCWVTVRLDVYIICKR